MNNLQKYQNVFIETFDVTIDELNDSFTFKDTEKWDSVTHLGLISELEDTFDVLFETEDILQYGSYLNGIEILKKYGVEF